MFFLTRVKGVYTFDDADSKRKMVIDVPKKQALINFDDWHLSFSGGVVSLLRENGNVCANVNHSLLYELLSIIFNPSYSDFTKWKKIELVDKAFSLSEQYPDLRFGGYINIDSGMFNGKFIQFCLDEDCTFHMGNWFTFLKLERIKQQMPQDLQEICLEYQEIFSDESFEKKNLIKLARFLKHNSKKQINRGMLCKLLYLLIEMPELWKEVRTQDDFFKVYKRIYEIYCLKENNEYLEKITKNESQIIEIEDMATENYCVVVPRSLEDLIVEGQQQNSCVGYYYCEDISANSSLIYFIRRKDNKSKSVYTCRYNTFINETVEYKGFNNSEIMDEEVLSFLKKIDYRLRSILKG